VRLRPPLREERQLLFLWGAAALALLVLAPALPALASVLPACPFRELTGLPCLTCGTTRAALSVLDRDLAGALRFNPLATLAGIAFLAGGLAAPAWALLAMPVPERLPSATPGRRTLAIAILLVAWGWQVIRGI
jgi:1,6-anhydro-N-acetylmuramate kinase